MGFMDKVKDFVAPIEEDDDYQEAPQAEKVEDDHGQVVSRAPPRELPLHTLRGHLRNHEGLRRGLQPRRRPAPGFDCRCQRRRAVRRTRHARRVDPDRVEA